MKLRKMSIKPVPKTVNAMSLKEDESGDYILVEDLRAWHKGLVKDEIAVIYKQLTNGNAKMYPEPTPKRIIKVFGINRWIKRFELNEKELFAELEEAKK